jgi:hypothetical protein
MCNFDVVNGRVTEVHRFINVPLRWTEQYPARERREIWVATPEGQEIKLVVHSRQMPARVGHQVDVLLLDGRLVGLRNVTTGAQVNFARVDPPLMWRRSDSLLMAVILVASFFALLFGSVAALFAGLILVAAIFLLVLLRRIASRLWTRRKVDAALDEIASGWGERWKLFRVK